VSQSFARTSTVVIARITTVSNASPQPRTPCRYARKSHNDQQLGRRDRADTGGPLVIRAQDLQHQHNDEGKERRADHRSGNTRVVGGDLGADAYLRRWGRRWSRENTWVLK
jgi:hypothetical protein